MVSDPRKSRAAFFQRHKMPPTGTFWIYFVDNVLPDPPEVPAESRRQSSDWLPGNSNCPLLSGSLDMLITNIPDIWKAEAKSIFAGRTLASDVNASSWRSGPSGVIEIDYQFSIVLEDYADGLDNFTSVIRAAFGDIANENHAVAASRVTELESQTLTRWQQLGTSRTAWQDSRYIGPRNGVFGRPSNRDAERDSLVSACETFILGHELAHHLLGHTVEGAQARRRKRLKAQSLLEQIYSDTNLSEVTSGLPPGQIDEIHCDILSFFVVAGAIDQTASYTDLYRAQAGAMVTLTALGHVQGDWMDTDHSADHPGIRRRMAAIELAVDAAAGGRTERGTIGDHPMGFHVQLRAYARLAEHAWFAEHLPEHVEPPRLLDHLAMLLEHGSVKTAHLPAHEQLEVTSTNVDSGDGPMPIRNAEQQ